MYSQEYSLPLTMLMMMMSLKICSLALLCTLHPTVKKVENEHAHTHQEFSFVVVADKKARR